MWESRGVGGISKGFVEREGGLLLAFLAFHNPVISTALFPHVRFSLRRLTSHSLSDFSFCCASSAR
mgnify:CR=1 FL=1